MPFYWNFKKLPELRQLPHNVQRRIWKRALREARVWRHLAIWIPAAIYLVATTIALALPIPTNLLAGGLWIYLTMCLGPGLAAIATISIALRKARPLIQRQVADEFGQSYCWTCGYDLRGHDGGVCPECGVQPLTDVRVRAQTSEAG